MDRPLPCAVFLVLAFTLAGLAQTLWLRSPLSGRFLVPIDGGRSLGGRRIFGDNKTWRGFFMVPAVGAVFLLFRLAAPPLTGDDLPGLWPLSPGEYGLLGCWVGFGFMAGELPNSFCKRRLDIAPGTAPAHPLGRIVCFACDRLDSIAGAFVALALVVPVSAWVVAYVLLIGPAIHWWFSVLLYRLGVKVRPA
jgi:CDP-2,3-bis-(O-geranylgeranyl)-sn-glycerol synthase